MLDLNTKRQLPAAFALSDNEKQNYSDNAVLLLNAKRVKDASDYWELSTCYEMGYGVEANKDKAHFCLDSRQYKWKSNETVAPPNKFH